MRLSLGEYQQLLPEADAGGDGPARAFAAIGELVRSGILVADDDAYRLAQAAYGDAIRSMLDRSTLQATHRRLAKVFKARGNTMTVPDHLLMAGDEQGALQTVVEDYDDVMGGQKGVLPIGRLRAYAEDTAVAVQTRQRLLEISEERGGSERERYILRRAVIQLANIHDPSLGRACIEPIVEQLKTVLGFQHWEALGPSASDEERMRGCLARATQTYDAADPRDRVLEPTEALQLSILTTGQGQNIARQAYDVRLLRFLLGFVERLQHLVPRLRGMRNTIRHALAFVTGRVDAARELRQELFEYYEGAVVPRPENPLYFLAQIGRGLLLQTEGSFWAVRGGARAEASAALLEDPLQGLPQEGNVLQRAGHSWLCGALEIRLLMHLFNGDAPKARRTQEQLDQLVMRTPYASDGGFVQLAAHGHALCGDLLALKQSVRNLESIVEHQHEGFSPFMHVARGDYHALRGKLEDALADYQEALDLTAAGEHAAWARANVSMVEALVGAGRAQQGLNIARGAVADCERVDLGPDTERSLERVLSLAEAATGSAETGLRRLERLRAAADADGIDGVPMGQLHETIARACLYANDHEGFRVAAVRAGEKYRAGGNPALYAKHERLLQAGRSAGVPSDSMSPMAQQAAGRASEAAGIQTELATLSDSHERHRVALRVMMERAGATSGFLFLWGDDSLELVAAADRTQPSQEMVDALTEYVKAELDHYVDVTVTCFDQQVADGQLPGFRDSAGDYRPVLLSHFTDEGSAVVGIAALLDTGEGFRMPDPEVVSTVSGELSSTQVGDDAVSLFELVG